VRCVFRGSAFGLCRFEAAREGTRRSVRLQRPREGRRHGVLELGGGQGRDTAWFAVLGFEVHVLVYANAGVDAALRRTTDLDREASSPITATQHDVRQALPFPDASFDACYSHMLF